MEIILRDHVEHVGRRGEVVKVADGYARNYLLPRKLALLATEGNKKHVERERKIMESREAEEKGQAEGVASRLASNTVSPTRITRTRSIGFRRTLRKCPCIRTSVERALDALDGDVMVRQPA